MAEGINNKISDSKNTDLPIRLKMMLISEVTKKEYSKRFTQAIVLVSGVA